MTEYELVLLFDRAPDGRPTASPRFIFIFATSEVPTADFMTRQHPMIVEKAER